jgi:choice-of-anchor C domain-containing protein
MNPMQLNLIWDPTTNSAPPGFKDAVNAAKSIIESHIKDNFTANIIVGWGVYPGDRTAITPVVSGNTIAEGGPNWRPMTYTDLLTDLKKVATSDDDQAMLAALPSAAPPGQFYVSNAQLKAWTTQGLNLLSPTDTGIDGYVGFSDFSLWDFSTNGNIMQGKYDLVGMATHELTHALGRVSPKQTNTSFDLFTYSTSTHGLDTANGTDQKYISLDGGKTSLSALNVSDDPADLLNLPNDTPRDPFVQGFSSNGISYAWTDLDSRTMDALGYDTGAPLANLVKNGSFEQGPSPGDYLPLQSGSTAITGWTVTRGAIDYVGSYFVASDGSRCLDLNGNPGIGGIAQTFATIPGQTYQVSFDMAGNTDLSNALQTMEVSAAGQAQDFTFVSGADKTHLGWQRDTWSFVANAPQTTLEFHSLHTADPYYGPTLDNVQVTPASVIARATTLPSASAQIDPMRTGSSASAMSFLATSESSHIISAQVSGETLIGSSSFGDTFQGTSANLNGDLIKLFSGNDVIDVTDLNFASATLSYSGTQAAGTLSLTDGLHNASIGLSGDFNQSAFHLASDLHGGTNISYSSG